MTLYRSAATFGKTAAGKKQLASLQTVLRTMSAQDVFAVELQGKYTIVDEMRKQAKVDRPTEQTSSQVVEGQASHGGRAGAK